MDPSAKRQTATEVSVSLIGMQRSPEAMSEEMLFLREENRELRQACDALVRAMDKNQTNKDRETQKAPRKYTHTKGNKRKEAPRQGKSQETSQRKNKKEATKRGPKNEEECPEITERGKATTSKKHPPRKNKKQRIRRKMCHV